jgi:hypothetical protein
MTALDFRLQPMTTTTTTIPTETTASSVAPAPRLAVDFAIVTGAWLAVVTAAATVPLDDGRVLRAALFVHLIGMALGFGSVVMIDVFGLMWLFGFKTLYELVDLLTVAHGVIAVGVGALLASGIALNPDLGSPLARLKMLLVLVLMLNGVWAQRLLRRMLQTLPPETRGANIPWKPFQKALTAALISQASWWGAIAIGFLTTTSRHR